MTKVDFIVAYNTNNISKCIECINGLKVPEGVMVGTLGIEGDNRIDEVYNACQQESGADYRVFLKENVYITNENFISDMLSFFDTNPSADAAGIVGGYRNGDFIEWTSGAVDIVNDDRADRLLLGASQETDYISGQLIVCRETYDWTSSDDKSFDITFSENAKAQGKILAVFPQTTPWCIWEYGGAYSERADVYDLEKGAFSYVGKRKPTVSIMIAIHNGADFVADTVESLLNQTYKNLQIILVDDASTDDSANIINYYAGLDSRIVPVFLPKNRHICYAINEAYKLATGEYVANMGHDDLCRPWKFEEQICFMEKFPEYVSCFSLCHIINDYIEFIDDRSRMTKIFDKKNTSREEWLRLLFMNGNCFCIPSAIIRKSMIPDGPFYKYDIVQLQDYDLWLRLLLKGSFHILQEKITLYRYFEKERVNLSNMDNEAENSPQKLKAFEEAKRIRAQFIMEIPDEEFEKVFKQHFKRQDSHSALELMCERAFLLLATENRRFYDVASAIMRTEEGTKLLDEKYGFSTIDFYGQEARFII